MKNNTKRNNSIINMLLKIKSSYLSLITRIKSFFQKQNQDKYDAVKVEDNQQHNQSVQQSDNLSLANNENKIEKDEGYISSDLQDKNEKPEIWYDAEEDEFFDALGDGENLKDGSAIDVLEDEGYISSSSQAKNIAAQNITIENDQYYIINDFEKTISLSSYSNNTLALAFGGKAIGKITNDKYNLSSLNYGYGNNNRLIELKCNTGDTNSLFSLTPNSFNIYMPSYLKNNQSKPPNEAFGDSQVVILLQKPESVNLPPKGIFNKSLWWGAEKLIRMANNPIEIKDSFPFDFINFSCSNGVSVSQSINRNSPNAFMLSLIDDISDKQKKIDWSVKDILVCGNCISLTKELADVKHLDNANVEPISNNHGSCVSL